jgi:hypothetical protein
MPIAFGFVRRFTFSSVALLILGSVSKGNIFPTVWIVSTLFVLEYDRNSEHFLVLGGYIGGDSSNLYR